MNRGLEPSGVCTRGPRELVLVKEMGCDDAMTCTVTARGRRLELRVVTHRTACKDSWPEVTVTCLLPRDVAPGPHSVSLDGTVLLDALVVSPEGALALPVCAPKALRR